MVPPRRFRIRLLVVMLAVGLLPLAVWGTVSHALSTRVLSLRLSQVEAVLGEAEERMGQEDEARRMIIDARLNLAQAELARRSLARILPRGQAVALLLSALLVGLAATVLGRQLGRPLRDVVSGMARYSSGDLEHRVPERPGKLDEMQFLVRQFNRMGDDLAAQRARLEVTEALAAWQGVARNLAHELKNPLTAMRLAVGRLERLAPSGGEDAQRRRESLDLLGREIERLLRLAQSFSAFARLPAPVLRRGDLAPILTHVTTLYGEQADIVTDFPSAVPVLADAALLEGALGNLLKNAIEAGGQGPIRVSASSDGQSVRVDIDDEGEGIGEELSGARLSRSLGTTKATGSGLGLPTAHRIIHEHGGSLRLAPRQQGGTRATVLLPSIEVP